MSNIVTRPHMRHNYRVGVSEEKRKAVQYALDKRREERGTTVIHVHERAPRPKCSMPGDLEMEDAIRAFITENGHAPARLVVPFIWEWIDHGFAVRGLPPHPDDLSGRYGRTGRWVVVHVVTDPDATEVRLE